jgi:hypothetical protein
MMKMGRLGRMKKREKECDRIGKSGEQRETANRLKI